MGDVYFFFSDSVLRHASSDSKKMGQRIFVFIIGGATRSEVVVYPYFFGYVTVSDINVCSLRNVASASGSSQTYRKAKKGGHFRLN